MWANAHIEGAGGIGVHSTRALIKKSSFQEWPWNSHSSCIVRLGADSCWGRVQALKEVESLRVSVGNYEKDKAALNQNKARLLQSEKHLKHLEWENEVRTFPLPSLISSADIAAAYFMKIIAEHYIWH